MTAPRTRSPGLSAGCPTPPRRSCPTTCSRGSVKRSRTFWKCVSRDRSRRSRRGFGGAKTGPWKSTNTRSGSATVIPVDNVDPGAPRDRRRPSQPSRGHRRKDRKRLAGSCVGDDSGEIRVMFPPGQGDDIQPGQVLRVTGKVKPERQCRMSMVDPTYEVIEDPGGVVDPRAYPSRGFRRAGRRTARGRAGEHDHQSRPAASGQPARRARDRGGGALWRGGAGHDCDRRRRAARRSGRRRAAAHRAERRGGQGQRPRPRACSRHGAATARRRSPRPRTWRPRRASRCSPPAGWAACIGARATAGTSPRISRRFRAPACSWCVRA